MCVEHQVTLTYALFSCISRYDVVGTGKTATVIAVITALQKEAESGKIPSFHFVEINCLRLKNPTDACKMCGSLLMVMFTDDC